MQPTSHLSNTGMPSSSGSMSSDPIHTGGFSGGSSTLSQPYTPSARQHPFASPGAPGTPPYLMQHHSLASGSNGTRGSLGFGPDMSGGMGSGGDPSPGAGGATGHGRESSFNDFRGGWSSGYSPAVGPGTPVLSSNGSYSHLHNASNHNGHQHQPSPPSYLASPAASPSPHPYTPPPPRHSSHQAGGGSLVRHGSLLLSDPTGRSGSGATGAGRDSRGLGGYGSSMLPGGTSSASGMGGSANSPNTSRGGGGGGWGEHQRTPTRHTIHNPLLSGSGGSGMWGWGGGGAADNSPTGPGSPAQGGAGGNITGNGWGGGGGGGGRRSLLPALNTASVLGDGGGSGLIMGTGSPRHLGGGGGGGGLGYQVGGGGGRGHQGGFSVYDMKSLSAALGTVSAGTGEVCRVLEAATFRPRLPGLTKLVSQLTREGNWQKGLEVFECLPVLGVRPDTTITNAAISACDKGGQWEKALQVFNAMEDWGLPRDAITYSAVISALSKGRQWSLAIDVFNHMSASGVECDAVACCSLITALDKGGHWQLAEQVFMQMYADHPQFSMLLQYMGDDGDGVLPGQPPATPPSNAAAAAALMGIMGSPPGQPPPPGSSDAVNDLAGMGEGAVAAVMQAWANAAAAAAGASDGQQPAGNGPVSPGSGRALNPATLAVLAEHLGEAGAAGARGLHPLLSGLPRHSSSVFPRIDEEEPSPAQPAPPPGATTDLKHDINQAPGPWAAARAALSGLAPAGPTQGSPNRGARPASGVNLKPQSGGEAGGPAAPDTQRPPSPSTPTGPAPGLRLLHGSTQLAEGGSSGNLLGPHSQPGTPGDTSAVTTATPEGQRAGDKSQRGTDQAGVAGASEGGVGPRARPPVIQLPDTLCGTPTAASAAAAGGVGGASPDVTQQLMLAQAQLAEMLAGKGSGPSSAAGTEDGATTPGAGGAAGASATALCELLLLSAAQRQEAAQRAAASGQGSVAALLDTTAGTGSGFPGTGGAGGEFDLTQAATSNAALAAVEAASALPASGQDQAIAALLLLGQGGEGGMEAFLGSPQPSPGYGARPPPSPLSRLSHNAILRSGSAPAHQLMAAAAAAGGARSPHHQQHHQRGLLRTSSLNTKKSAPNRVCCNALLAAYARAVPTQWRRALQLLELMWACGGELTPDIVSYNTVVKACGNAGQVDLGFQLYELMCNRGVEATVATYGTLICIAAAAGLTGRVRQAWGWLRASGLEVHVTCANAYLQALVKEGDWEAAQRLFSSMMGPNPLCRPNAVTFSVMMAAHLQHGSPGAIKQLYCDMVSLGLQPSSSTMSSLVNAFAQRGLWDDAVAVLGAMCRQDSPAHRPSATTFCALISALRDAARALPQADISGRKALGRRMVAVRNLMRAMPGGAPGMEPSTFRTLAAAFAAAAEPDVCLELFNSMAGSGLPVDPDVSASVLGAVCESGAWAKAVALVQAVQEGGVPGPPLPPRVLVGVLRLMDGGKAWGPAIRVAQVAHAASLHGRGSFQGLVEGLKGAGATDPLLACLMVDKASVGSWGDALTLFAWARQSTPFSSSPEAHHLLLGVLASHGGIEGLRQAVLIARQATSRGLLHAFSLPSTTTGSSASARGDEGDSGAERGTRVVLPAGEGAGVSLVLLLAWVSSLADAAREVGAPSLLQSLPSLTATIQLPAASPEAAALAASAAAGAGHGQGGETGSSSGGGQCDPQAAAAVTLVLSGGYMALFGLEPGSMTQQDEELFPLRAPGVNYMQDPSNPCTVHVSLSDLCNALHLGTKGAAQQQQE